MIDSRTEDVGCARLLQQITGRFFCYGKGKVMETSKRKNKRGCRVNEK